MTKASLTVVAAVAAATLLGVGPATSAPQAKGQRFKASLTARAEVPKPKGVPPRALGRFRASATDRSDGRVTLRWRLAYRRLSGKAVAAYIHLGKPRKAGPAKVTLCRKCKSRMQRRTTIGTGLAKALASGRAYVNIPTAKNPKGEIRGQIKVLKGRRRH